MPDQTPLLRRPMTWLVAAVAALVVAVGAVAAVLLGGAAASDTAAETAAPAARPLPASSPAPVPVPVAPPAPDASGIPADCAEAYTRDWSGDFAPDYVLNPEWSTGDAAPVLLGTETGAAPLLEATARLTCAWVPAEPSDGSIGLVTTLAAVDEAQASEALLALEAGQLDCFEEEGGTRCIAEWEDENGPAGESHFLRDGVWIATRWSGPAVSGYTLDIVAALFG